LSSHLALLEEQLSDGREWLFDTVHPGYGDLSLHFFYAWIQLFRSLKDVLSSQKVSKTIAWVNRVSQYLKNSKEAAQASIENIKGDTAAKLISDSAGVDIEAIDFDEEEGSRLGVRLGSQVAITPDDNAKNFPTVGKLLDLNREEVIIETAGSAAKSVRCHFPRLNFTVRPAGGTSSKL